MTNNKSYEFKMRVPGYYMQVWISPMSYCGVRQANYEIFQNGKDDSIAYNTHCYMDYTLNQIKSILRQKLEQFKETYILDDIFYNKD